MTARLTRKTPRLRVIGGGLRHLPATFPPPRGKDVAPECRSGSVVRPPEWWWSRHDPDWAVIDAALAEMYRDGVLHDLSPNEDKLPPRLRVVR